MLTNRKPVNVLVSRLLMMIKIKSKFPVTAPMSVREYSTVMITVCEVDIRLVAGATVVLSV